MALRSLEALVRSSAVRWMPASMSCIESCSACMARSISLISLWRLTTIVWLRSPRAMVCREPTARLSGVLMDQMLAQPNSPPRTMNSATDPYLASGEPAWQASDEATRQRL